MPLQQKLPVIDFNIQTLKPSTHDWLSTSLLVRQALEDYGCFVICTDKIPWDLRETMFELTKDLFRLPLETKIKNTSEFKGFGYENYPFLPLYECFGIENVDTLDAIQNFSNLLYPSGNNAFCKTTFEYTKLLSEINNCLLRMVFDSYGIEDKQWDTFYLARFIKYESPTQGEGPIALHAHTDKNFLAVLDDKGLKGLEVQMRTGEWIYHEPSPTTYVVIAGEPLTAWSNGRIYTPVHRVAMRFPGKEVVRYTIGLFSLTREMVEVPEKLVDDEHILRFKPFSNLGLLKYLFTDEGRAANAANRAIESYCGVNTNNSTDG